VRSVLLYGWGISADPARERRTVGSVQNRSRCESATLRTHWVLVVMDQFTRRIVGLGVQGGIVDGAACAA
jgi:hypothetical protein